MNIPKVEFSVAPIEKSFSSIYYFLNPSKDDWDWSERILTNYPKLRNKLKNIKDTDKRREIERLFFTEFYKREIWKLEKRVNVFQREWNKINDDAVLVLSEVVEQEWSEKDEKISARITLNPICPRYIKQRAFDVFYRQKPKHMKSVTMHELLHFIYFEKWKKIFPETNERKFDAPYLVWKLSEMVPAIILNDERIQKVLKYKFDSYKEYENFKLDGKPLLSYLQDVYENRKDFADFLKKSWEFVNKHKKEINSI